MSTWVCLRGLSRGNIHWGDFRDVVQRTYPNDKFLWLEFPGNGERYKEKSPLFIDDYVDDIRLQLRDVLKEQKKVRVLAMSFGAMVTVRWAERFPEEVEKAVLVNTSHSGLGIFERLRVTAIKHLVMILFYALEKKIEQWTEGLHSDKLKADRLMEKEVLLMTSNSSQAFDKYHSVWAQYASKHPLSLRNFAVQLFAASQAKFPPLPPTKINLITSRNDRMVSWKCSKNISEMWKLPLIEHPWAGHDIPLDDPQNLANQLA